MYMRKPNPEVTYKRYDIPRECVGCNFDGKGSEYCGMIQQYEMQKQYSFIAQKIEPKTSEEFFLDCPKRLEERITRRSDTPLFHP